MAEERREETTLVLEDDIDVEYSFDYLSRVVLKALPEAWDMVFLGHCLSDESRGGLAGSHPLLYHYSSAQCKCFLHSVLPCYAQLNPGHG